MGQRTNLSPQQESNPWLPKQHFSMLLCICSVIDHRGHQHKWHLPNGLVCHFFVLTIFEIICDLELLLNRCTATWNLFVLYIKETKKCYWRHVLNIFYHSVLIRDCKLGKWANGQEIPAALFQIEKEEYLWKWYTISEQIFQKISFIWPSIKLPGVSWLHG